MANKYQDAILNAVDYLVNNRVSSLDRDKTITATIVACNNSITQEYKVSYNGGYILAYAQENTTYQRDASVFVLVPEGDFSKKKTIIGLASSSSTSTTFVSSLINDYNKIGENTLSNQRRWGLNSYKKEDYKLIYQHGYTDDNFLTVDEAHLLLYIAQAEALLLQGTFQTALPRAHRVSSTGKYGVSFTLAFKNGDEQTKKYSADRVGKIGVSNAEFQVSDTDFLVTNKNAWTEVPIFVGQNDAECFLKRFYAQRKEISSEWAAWYSDGSNGSFSSARLNQLKSFAERCGVCIDSYYEKVRNAVSQYEVTEAGYESSANIIGHYIEYVQNNFQEDEKWLNTCVSIVEHIKEHDDSLTDNNALSTLLGDFLSDLEKATADTYQNLLVSQETPAIKYISYTLDSTNMLGNPMVYTSETTQYNIFQVDSANFQYIDSILLFSRNFVDEDDTTIHKDNNIFFSNFYIYGLQKISATSGDYTLRISTPSGAVFKTAKSTEKLYVEANLTKINDDLSDTASFYWFAKDDRINSSSENYRAIAGSGWRFLEAKGQTKELELLASENKAYENKYLCVANYKESLILKSNFIIYNESCQKEISIATNYPLTEFCVDRGIPEMTCTIDGKSEKFEEGKTNGHSDSLFTFCWSVTDNNGNVTTLNQTKEQLEAQLKEARENGEGYSKLMSIQNSIAKLEGVTIDKNLLIYPVSLFEDSATFSCSVFLQDNPSEESYFIGSAEITLKNNAVADPVDYSIRIENGDQVFQYSESGVTPASERYTDPQDILPLTCHFYDKQGIEVNSNTYTVKWRVPLTDTMIVTPSEGMATNPATMLEEWYMTATYPTDIAASYDYQALHNQVTCIVTYQGIEYTQDTAFSFLKIGDNGTNGTDVVAKIYPKYTDSGKLFALVEDAAGNVTTNVANHSSLSSNPLQFELYRRNDTITPTTVSWSISGKHAKHLGVAATKSDSKQGELSWGNSTTDTAPRENQIVKATTTYTISSTSSTDSNSDNSGETNATSLVQAYNAFYPVPYIKYHLPKTDSNYYTVDLDRDLTIKQVLYNADGRNPMYNKKQGLVLSLGCGKKPKTVLFYVSGGKTETTSISKAGESKVYNTSSLRLSAEENGSFSTSETRIKLTNFTDVETETNDGKSTVKTTRTWNDVSAFVVPADVYSGEYSNNVIKAMVYDGENIDFSTTKTPEVEVVLPVYLSLNTYGLASLNAWDGNHIEINEEDNYILAPQIGAGYKGKDPNDENRDNVFTGIVMGQAKTYDDNDSTSTTGLLGYSGGKQSIWLDAVTGKAVFGLPSDAGSQDNGYNEGRIKLIPGGNSQIGNWTIGSSALYNAKLAVQNTSATIDGWNGIYNDEAGDEKSTAVVNAISTSDTYKDENGKTQHYKNDKTDCVYHEYYGGIPQYNSATGKIEYSSTTGDGVKDSPIALPHNAQGTILSANPAYLSIKGKPLVDNGDDKCDINFKAAGCTIVPGDSFEVEIDPNKANIFSVYRHTNVVYDKDTSEICKDDSGEYLRDRWWRQALVGIDNQGRFFTNSLKDGKTSMTIGDIGAFGANAADKKYIGSTFGTSSHNILKFFTEYNKPKEGGYTTYLTTGFSAGSGIGEDNGEYPQHFNIHGKTINLYSNESTANSDSKANYGYETNISKTSGHYLKLTDDSISLGHHYEKDKTTRDDVLKIVSNSDKISGTENSRVNSLVLESASTDIRLSKPLTAQVGVNSGEYSSINLKTEGNIKATVKKGYQLFATGKKDSNNGYGIILNYNPPTADTGDLLGYGASLRLRDDIILKKTTSCVNPNDGNDKNKNNVLTINEKGETTYSNYGAFHINTASSKNFPSSILAGGEGGLVFGVSPMTSGVDNNNSAYFDIDDFSSLNNFSHIQSNNNSAYLQLIPSTGSNAGQFILSGSNMQINSNVWTNEVNNTTFSVKSVDISPGLRTQWGIFEGGTDRTYYDPSQGYGDDEHPTNNDYVTIRSFGNIVGRNFIFGTEKGNPTNYSYSGFYSVDTLKLKDILNNIYGALNDLDSRVTTVNNRVDAFKDKYNSHSHVVPSHSHDYTEPTGKASVINEERKGVVTSLTLATGKITVGSGLIPTLLGTQELEVSGGQVVSGLTVAEKENGVLTSFDVKVSTSTGSTTSSGDKTISLVDNCKYMG